MNELPIEIFNKIMVLLPLRDKMEFMTVCKKWSHAIETCCLLETIRIDSKRELNRIVEKLENKPPEAKQVKRLILDLYIEPNFDLVHFFNQFPNLQFILMGNSEPQQFQQTIPSKNNRIESLVDIYGQAMSSYFLESGNCSHLRRLEINSNKSYSYIDDNTANLFPRLLLLDTLILDTISISLQGLETIHAHSPSLRSFTLSNLIIIGEELRTRVTPAPTVAVLHILMVDTVKMQRQPMLFQYASKKYNNLLEFLFSGKFMDETPEEIDQFYSECMIPFIQPLATQLQRYELDLGVLPDRFLNILSQINLNIKYAHIQHNYKDINPGLEKCIQKDQAKYMTELSLITESDFNFTLLKEFSALKVLNIVIDDDGDRKITYTLSDILKVCCITVEDLNISCVILKYDPLDTQEYKNIKSLSLSHVYLDRGIDILISRYLPNINYLHLDNCGFTERKLYLSKINLLSLIIRAPLFYENNALFHEEHLNLLVCTRNDDKRTMWISKKFTSYFDDDYYELTDHSVYPQVKSVPFDDTKLYPTLIFDLASVKNVFIR